MKETVSVLIPVYQSEKFLEKCVKSIVEQTYPDIEIILIDDGSTDGSSALCDKLASYYTNIKVFHQINSGVSVTRNKALELAEGQYVIFVDSDDFLEKDIIKKAVESYKNDEIDLCVFGFQRVSLNTYTKYNKNIAYNTDKILNIDEVKAELLYLYSSGILHAIGSKMYKKSIIDKFKLRFRENWEYYEDIFFCLSYINMCKKSIKFVNDVGYYYRGGNYESLSYKAISNEKEPVFETFYLLKEMLGRHYLNDKNKRVFYKQYEACLVRLKTKSGEAEKRADKFYNMFLLMNKWMNNYLRGKTVEQFLLQKKYYSIAIYGMNYMGKTLLEELKNSRVNVEYAIDRNADNISIEVKVFKFCDNLPKVDMIIVTAINSYNEIKEHLEKNGIYNVISLEEIVNS